MAVRRSLTNHETDRSRRENCVFAFEADQMDQWTFSFQFQAAVWFAIDQHRQVLNIADRGNIMLLH